MSILRKASAALAKVFKRSGRRHTPAKSGTDQKAAPVQAKAEAGAEQKAAPIQAKADAGVRIESTKKAAAQGQRYRKEDSQAGDLLQPVGPETPYPVDSLGARGQKTAEAVSTMTQAPIALCAQSTLAALSMMASPHVDIVAPHGQIGPTSLFLKTIAVSGERKSAADKLVLKGLKRLQQDLRYEFEEELRRIKKEDPTDETRPPSAMLFIQDATWEGILKTLNANRGCAGFFNADAADLVRGAGMGEENKAKMGAGLSRLWDGDEVSRTRQLDGETIIAHKRISVHLLFQPTIAAGFIDDPTLDGQGYFARCLISWPSSTIGTRLFRHTPKEARETVNDFQEWTYDALKAPPRYRPRSRNDLDPRPLMLTAGAEQNWIRFYNDVERALGDGGKYSAIQAFGAKAAEHALRLAAVLSWSDDCDIAEVGVEGIDRGIALTQYYLTEMLRLRGAHVADPDAAALANLLVWVKKQKSLTVSSDTVNHRGPKPFRSDWKKVRQGLDELAARGHLKPISTRQTKTAEHVTYQVCTPDAA